MPLTGPHESQDADRRFSDTPLRGSPKVRYTELRVRVSGGGTIRVKTRRTRLRPGVKTRWPAPLDPLQPLHSVASTSAAASDRRRCEGARGDGERP